MKVITNGDGSNAQRVLNLGASHSLITKKEDYTKILKDVDYVLDTLEQVMICKCQMKILMI